MLNDTPKAIGSLHVAELARQAEVTSATVRYYSRVGLLSPRREPENGYRCFSAADLHRVLFIRQAQTLGLTIGDIKAILETVDHGETPCHQVRSLVEQRLGSVQEKLAELHATEMRIGQALEAWQEMHDEAPVDGELCPLIERLNVGEMRNKSSACRPTVTDRCHCPPVAETATAMPA